MAVVENTIYMLAAGWTLSSTLACIRMQMKMRDHNLIVDCIGVTLAFLCSALKQLQ